MFCRKCLYCLDQVTENRCPECGCPFDPLDGRSYLDSREVRVRLLLPRLLVWFLVGLIAVAAAFLILLPLVYRLGPTGGH